MSSVLTAAAGTGTPAHTVWTGALQGLGRRQFALIAVFALCIPLMMSLFSVALGETVLLPFLLYDIAACLAIGSAAQLSALAAHNLLRHRIGTAGRVALAILVATAAATALLQLIGLAVAEPLGLEQLMAREGKAFASTAHRIVYQMSGALKWSLVLVVLCELLETNRRAQGELHAVRMAALAAERDLVEGELRAMQARVDPDLLFDSLLEIDRRYARDAADGQKQLDALIRFLRAALPGDGGGSSVALEQELVEAYVALVRSHRGLTVDFAVAPAARQEPMPAMLLLPLVKWALDERGARRAKIDIAATARALIVLIESDAADVGAAPDGDLAPVRERLEQLYPAGAELQVRATDGARRVALKIPARPRAAV